MMSPEKNNFVRGQANKQAMSVISLKEKVLIFTILSVVLTMKEKLGLEAMLEYINNYLTIMGDCDPQLKETVGQVLGAVNVERMYHDAVRKRKEF
jgi:hypothetical protein